MGALLASAPSQAVTLRSNGLHSIRRLCHRPTSGSGVVRTVAAAGGAGNQFWRSFQDSLGSQASTAKARFQKWSRNQRLEERFNAGLEAAGRAAQQAAQQAQSTARRVDEEYGVSGKAAEAARTVNEAAEDLDSRFQLRRRVRNLFVDLKRTLPNTMRQISDFFSTPLGAVTFFFLFLVSVFTGAFWVIVRWLVSFFWLGILLSPLIINYLNARMVQEQQQRYREYAEEQQRRQANPFHGTIFEDLFARGQRSGSKKVTLDSQDVIDVSYDHIDD